MRATAWVLPIVGSLLFPVGLAAQGIARADSALIDSVVRAELRAWGAPGLVLGIVRRDSLVFLKAYGIANLETGEPLTTDMLMSVASVTKTVTATVALAQASEGKLDLNSPIRSYLPWTTNRLGALTTSQLLSNTAGLGDLTPELAPQLDGALAPICRAMTDSAFVAEPQATWGYTNSGYTLAGCVIESAGGNPFPLVVAKHVFEPLGMRHSTFDPRVAMTYRHSQGHDTRKKPATVLRPFGTVPFIAPAGELITTVTDLSRLARALLSDGMLEGKRVLPAGVLESLTTVRGRGGAFLGGERDYGYGLFTRTHRGFRIAEHEGIYGGFGASFALAPAHGAAAIAIANGRFASPVRTAQAALEIVAGMRPSARALESPRVSAADSLAMMGRYAAIEDTFELTAHAGQLAFRQGSRLYRVVARPEGHWEVHGYTPYAPLPAVPLEVVRAPGSRSASFVRFAWRVYRRLP
jgi:CubicO group peptidase (beta-lactamase class C family)